MADPGILYILSSPSGGGKTTLANRLLAAFPHMGVSVSYTTRKPRTGEREGVDYHFVDDERFNHLVNEGAFAEWAQVHGNRYGTARRVIDEDIAGGRDLLFDVDYQGARALKAAYPHAVAALILPPSWDVLEARLRGRAKDSPETITQRLHNAVVEIGAWEVFDYIVVNDELDQAFAELHAIVVAARCRRERRSGLARAMLDARAKTLNNM